MKKIGLCQWCLASNLVDAITICHQSGCSVIHAESGSLHSVDWSGNPDIYHQALKLLDDYQMKCVALSANELCEIGLVHPVDSITGKKARQIIQSTIDLAVRMQVSQVVLPSFFASEIKSRTDFYNTQRQLQYAVQYGEYYNVQIVSENGLSITKQTELLKMIPSLHLLFDTQNPLYYDQNPFDQLRELTNFYCNLVHIKDGSQTVLGNCMLGSGIVPLVPLVKHIEQTITPEYWVIETEYIELGTNIDFMVQKDIKKLKKLLANGKI